MAAPPTAAAPSTFGHCGGQGRRKGLFTQGYRIARPIGSLCQVDEVRSGWTPRKSTQESLLQVVRVKRVALAEIAGLIAASEPADALFGCAVRK